MDGDCAAQHLGQVAGGDGDFATEIIRPPRPPGQMVPATLSEVFAGHHAESGGNYLQENRHEACQAYDKEEVVFEPGSGAQVCGPVSRIHVTHADEHGWSRERDILPPWMSGSRRKTNGTVEPLQRATPLSWFGHVVHVFHFKFSTCVVVQLVRLWMSAMHFWSSCGDQPHQRFGS